MTTGRYDDAYGAYSQTTSRRTITRLIFCGLQGYLADSSILRHHSHFHCGWADRLAFGIHLHERTNPQLIGPEGQRFYSSSVALHRQLQPPGGTYDLHSIGFTCFVSVDSWPIASLPLRLKASL